MGAVNQDNDDFFDDFEPDLEEGEVVDDIPEEDDFSEEDSVEEVGQELEAEKPKDKQKKELKPVESAKAEVSLDSLGLDFGSIAAMPGVVVGDIGLEVSRFPVERAKFTKNARALISIISSQVIAVKSHYSETIGSFLCWGGKCCETGDLARVKYLFPIVLYDTDKRGKPVSKDIEFRCLAIGKDQYEDILAIQDLNGDIANFDLLVSCKDEQYQKLSFQLAGEARWKKSRSLREATVEFWKENLKNITKCVARQMTEKEYLRILQEEGVNETTEEVDFDEVFDD